MRKTGMPVQTKPMTTTVIISAGRSVQFALRVFSRALAKMRQTKRNPTPIGKKDQVISDEPKVQMECGAPKLISTTTAQPTSKERTVTPVPSCCAGLLANAASAVEDGVAVAGEENHIDDKREPHPEEVPENQADEKRRSLAV